MLGYVKVSCRKCPGSLGKYIMVTTRNRREGTGSGRIQVLRHTSLHAVSQHSVYTKKKKKFKRPGSTTRACLLEASDGRVTCVQI